MQTRIRLARPKWTSYKPVGLIRHAPIDSLTLEVLLIKQLVVLDVLLLDLIIYAVMVIRSVVFEANIGIFQRLGLTEHKLFLCVKLISFESFTLLQSSLNRLVLGEVARSIESL